MGGMHMGAARFAQMLENPVRDAVLEAIRLTPEHMVPQVLADSQSQWITVSSIPGPSFAIWRETGDIYVVGEDGAVGEEPIKPGKNKTEPPPEGFVWGCEDCANEGALWVTSDTNYATFHSDAHGHSLALRPLGTLGAVQK